VIRKSLIFIKIYFASPWKYLSKSLSSFSFFCFFDEKRLTGHIASSKVGKSAKKWCFVGMVGAIPV